MNKMAGAEAPPKWVFDSTTIRGLLVTLIGLVVSLWGIPGVDDGQIQEVAGGLATLIGFGLTVWGRTHATQPLTLSRSVARAAGPAFEVKGQSLVVGGGARVAKRARGKSGKSGRVSPWVLLIIVVMCAGLAGLWALGLQGCAAKNLSPDQAGRVAAGEIAQAYLAADAAYDQALADALAAGDQDTVHVLRADVAPALNQAKRWTVLVGRVAIGQSLVADYRAALEAWDTAHTADPDQAGQQPQLSAFLTPEYIASLQRATAASVGEAVGGKPGEVLAYLASSSDRVYAQSLDLVDLVRALVAPLNTDREEEAQ